MNNADNIYNSIQYQNISLVCQITKEYPTFDYYSIYKNINLKLIYNTSQQAEHNIQIINFIQILQISVKLCLIFHRDH